MDSTITSATDRRRAQRRVGAATILAFLALLLLGATRGSAKADPVSPVPTAAPTVQPRETTPLGPDDHDHDGPWRGRGRGGDGGPGFGGGGGGGGGGTAPAPSSGGTGTQT